MLNGSVASRRTSRVALVAVGLALLAWPALALARDEAAEPIPITDPALLERLGFDLDATNVFATPEALQQLLMDPAERALAERAGLEDSRAAQETQPAGGPYGTGTFGFSPVWGKKFLPNGTATEYSWDQDEGRYCLSGPANFHAQFEDIPNGAHLIQLWLWYFDASAEAIEATVFRQCQDPSGGSPSTLALNSFTSSTAAGHAGVAIPLTAIPVNVQSLDCVYYVRVRLDDTNADCSEADDLAITKAALQWVRQVSPAPATATFDDVPTSHPFFQHIEALAASDITGGCGDGSSYCPNAPLTRGEMAVFLAKALGLHWGTF